MTETEWLACTDPQPMLDFLEGNVSARKLLLLLCACYCDRPDLDAGNRKFIATTERFAEGAGSQGERRSAAAAVPRDLRGLAESGAWQAEASIGERITDGDAASRQLFSAEQRRQAAWLRHIVGNPFRPITFEPAWRTPLVLSVAEAIYRECAFDRLRELARHLEDAGCTNREILSHCREEGEHARGCWVIDLILQKA